MKIDNRYKTKHWSDLQKLGKYKGELLLLSKLLLLSLLMIFHMVSLYAQTPRKDSGVNGQVKYELAGRVVSASDGTPMQGVSIRIDKENLQIKSSQDGTFEMLLNNRKGKIIFSYVGFKTQEINYTSGVSLTVKLIPEDNKLQEVEVVSTGYQKIPKERATGSFEFVDNKLFNRKVSTDFVSRLEDVVPGISALKNNTNRGSLLNVNIRGISTMNSERWPLIVLDGVPYDSRGGDYGKGTFNNINPNDIESVTVLKDAAASSIWGAQSGNGVIVITTKRGKFNNPTSLSFNSNISIKAKPDLYYYPQMKSSDYIDLQQYLFDKGRYNGQFNQWYYNPEPALWLMENKRTGKISNDEFNKAIGEMRATDMRDDFLKYIYRRSVNQQYNLQLQSGGEKINTIFSVGYDKNLNEVVTSSYQRLNLKTNTQLRPVKNMLVDIGMMYTESKTRESVFPVQYNQIGKGAGMYPYMNMADENGNPLVVDIASFNPVYQDTVAGGRLLDWSYRPLKELYDTKETQKVQEFFSNINTSYSFDFGLKLNLLYAYQRSIIPIEQWQGIGSYFQRDDINGLASYTDEAVTWNLPVGDFLGISNWNNIAHQGRMTADYNRKWLDKHELSFLLGSEIRMSDKKLNYAQYHGFDPETGAFKPVAYGVEFPFMNGSFGTKTIVDRSRYEHLRNNFISYFANAGYTYDSRYLLSGSFRKDASNLFGVKSNDRGQPFWSVGAAWIASNEAFLKDSPFSFLKLRATYGYNGNVNNMVSAYPIMSIESQVHFINNQQFGMITRPPNPKLRWERVGIKNIGLDFAMNNNWLSGSIEYYEKNAKDLIASDRIDPSTGFSTMMVNSANLKTKGWDISLNALPVQSKNWVWGSNLVFSYIRTKVLKAFVQNDIGQDYIAGGLTSNRNTPFEGMDLFGLLAYKWAGLDPETGEPRAYLNGEISKDYSAITNLKATDLEYMGSTIPLYTGSWRNSVRYKAVELSWNISYQLGHKFLRNSFSNNSFLNDNIGHKDYALRWQKPGDEQITDVPAFSYPNNSNASRVYMGSTALVENGGQIKLRDIQLTVNLPFASNFKLKNCKIYGYVQNIGTIWRANKWGIDSEYGPAIPDPLMSSLGFSFNL
ncbi:SusC/RagA family TonB-linked outer membrane protein [Sphingobacterium anhuiense]|uniref:SusC/RagA family TonB-linked outer membrane protein n=1 Tax=Sphingobacterium anhuiense TaxID=493780 RepID=A0ABW5YVV3_9SPHI